MDCPIYFRANSPGCRNRFGKQRRRRTAKANVIAIMNGLILFSHSLKFFGDQPLASEWSGTAANQTGAGLDIICSRGRSSAQ